MAKRAKPIGEGRRVPLLARTTPELRAALDQAAATSGRSLAQEVEVRLARTFDYGYIMGDLSISHMLRAMGSVAATFSLLAGKDWDKDDGIRKLVFEGIQSLLDNWAGINPEGPWDDDRLARIIFENLPDEAGRNNAMRYLAAMLQQVEFTQSDHNRGKRDDAAD